MSNYKPPRVQPIVALRALINLLKNPQDTRQVALLTAALRGRSGLSQLRKFKASPVGLKILAEGHRLGDVLDNHAYLATLGENSLGRHYLAFMSEDNLTAKGLTEVTAEATNNLDPANKDALIFAGRTRDLHDLYHVIAGYGRDEIGEICVLAFSYPQQRLRSFAVIAFFGTLNFSSILARHKLGPGAVVNAVLQAYRNGKQAAWLPGEDIDTMLTQDIDNVRRQLGITPPDKYLTLLSRIRAKTQWRGGPIFSGQQIMQG
jgi:ubiquinone biosynthesis protein COQ4